jgi:hypothetical protein
MSKIQKKRMLVLLKRRKGNWHFGNAVLNFAFPFVDLETIEV